VVERVASVATAAAATVVVAAGTTNGFI